MLMQHIVITYILEEGARFEASADLETIGSDSTVSFHSQTLAYESKVGGEPMKPDRTR